MVINKFRCSIYYAENGTRTSSLSRITKTIRTIKAGKNKIKNKKCRI